MIHLHISVKMTHIISLNLWMTLNKASLCKHIYKLKENLCFIFINKILDSTNIFAYCLIHEVNKVNNVLKYNLILFTFVLHVFSS